MKQFDYTNQAWTVDGRYIPCGHVGPCDCYGTAHAGEFAPPCPCGCELGRFDWPSLGFTGRASERLGRSERWEDMATRYRVYIGEVTVTQAADMAAESFQGATVTYGVGVWEGQTEDCAIVEVIDLASVGVDARVFALNVQAFAQRACAAFNQDCVLVTSESVTADLVTAVNLDTSTCVDCAADGNTGTDDCVRHADTSHDVDTYCDDCDPPAESPDVSGQSGTDDWGSPAR